MAKHPDAWSENLYVDKDSRWIPHRSRQVNILPMWQQRLTKEELVLARKLPHTLSRERFEERKAIMMRQTKIDMQWGFFNDGLWAAFKRHIYMTFVHRVMKK